MIVARFMTPLRCGIVTILLSAQAASAFLPEPTPTAAPNTIAPGAELEKDYAKELGKGRFLDNFDARHRAAKPYAPSSKEMQPFANAAVGALIAVHLAGGVEFADAPAAQRLCQQTVDRLLEKGWKGMPVKVPVYIVAEPYYGARVMPSGIMLVSIGTFNRDPSKGATSTEELALLLGHELGHMLVGHLGDQRTMNGLIKALTITSNSYLTFAQVRNTRMNGNQLQVAGDAKAYRRGLVGALATQTLLQDLLTPSFGRGKELEADRAGIDLARRAGYIVDEGDANTFVEHHGANALLESRRMLALSTVLSAMNSELARKLANRVGGGFNDIVRQASEKLGQMLIDQLAKTITQRTKDHPDEVQRKQFLKRYFDLNYGGPSFDADGRLMARDDVSVHKVDATPQIALLLDNVQVATKARADLVAIATDPSDAQFDANLDKTMKNAGLKKAAPAAAAVIKAKGKPAKGGRKPLAPTVVQAPRGFANDAAPMTWYVQGKLQEVGGEPVPAAQSLRRALDAPLANTIAAQDWARNVLFERRTTELPPVIERFARTLGTTDPVIDLVVGAAMAKGDVGAAEVAAGRCSTYDAGRLYPSCVNFLGYDPLNSQTPPQTDAGRKAFSGKGLERIWIITTSVF